MTFLDKSCSALLAEGKQRDHIVLWHKTNAVRDAVVGEFLEAGGEKGDFIAIALCLGDFEGLERAISKKLHTLESLVGNGDMVMFVSCEFLPRKDGTHRVKAKESFAEFEGKVTAEKRGLRLVGSVPFAILTTGDTEECLEMERIGGESLKRGRLLCLYDIRMLRNVGPDQMTKVNETHTHVLVEDETGKVILSVRHPQKP